MSVRFAGRRVVVTGAARGIGAEIARRFAAEGAKVAVLDRLAVEAKDVAAEIGGSAHEVDLRDVAGTRAAVRQAIGELGGIDVLVNNAGILRFAALLDIDPEEWDDVFAVNTRSMLVTTQVAARVMIDAGGGVIVNSSSMGGKAGGDGQAHYAASKAAVIALTACVRATWPPRWEPRPGPRRRSRPGARCPRWGVSASPRTSRGSSRSWRPTTRRTSRARRSTSPGA
jgi:3-oxoacyl-[acyl-carrier protein] reductase